ncbi:MAG: LacI family transcriptional regulator, partial [Alphaproteobacteria bacterium]
TRKRVQALAREMNYVPNRAGLRLRTGKTHVISLILNPHEEVTGYSTALISGISQSLKDTQYHLVVTPNFINESAITPVDYIIHSRAADGIIFSRTMPDDPRVHQLLKHNIAFACHGRTEINADYAYVDFDNEAFASLAVDRLVSLGRRKIGAIAPPDHITYATLFNRGFKQALARHGLFPYEFTKLRFDSPPELIQAELAQASAQNRAPDGLICAGELPALAAIAGYQQNGLDFGSDFNVVAKQTSAFFDYHRPAIDTVKENLFETGHLLGTHLLARLDHPEAPAPRSILPALPCWRD